MDFTYNKQTNLSFEVAVKRIKAELQNEGFGVITEIDLKDKFKEKLNIDFRPYLILGACNPKLAHKAVLLEDKIGVMLPCNVLVQENEAGEAEVSAINPLASIGAAGNERLESLAEEVSRSLKRVLERI